VGPATSGRVSSMLTLRNSFSLAPLVAALGLKGIDIGRHGEPVRLLLSHGAPRAWPSCAWPTSSLRRRLAAATAARRRRASASCSPSSTRATWPASVASRASRPQTASSEGRQGAGPHHVNHSTAAPGSQRRQARPLSANAQVCAWLYLIVDIILVAFPGNRPHSS